MWSHKWLFFATSVKSSYHKILPFFHKFAKPYPFHSTGFHTPAEWKIAYKVINKQVIIQIFIVTTAFYMYGNIRLKEISILNLFEQIQKTTCISGSAFSARLGSLAVAFISYPTIRNGQIQYTVQQHLQRNWQLHCWLGNILMLLLQDFLEMQMTECYGMSAEAYLPIMGIYQNK